MITKAAVPKHLTTTHSVDDAYDSGGDGGSGDVGSGGVVVDDAAYYLIEAAKL